MKNLEMCLYGHIISRDRLDRQICLPVYYRYLHGGNKVLYVSTYGRPSFGISWEAAIITDPAVVRRGRVACVNGLWKPVDAPHIITVEFVSAVERRAVVMAACAVSGGAAIGGLRRTDGGNTLMAQEAIDLCRSASHDSDPLVSNDYWVESKAASPAVLRRAATIAAHLNEVAQLHLKLVGSPLLWEHAVKGGWVREDPDPYYLPNAPEWTSRIVC